jgi:hypothetical protein
LALDGESVGEAKQRRNTGEATTENQTMKTMNHTEYPRRLWQRSVEELRFIIKDATEAQRANPSNPNNGYYADEVLYAAAELSRRKLA